ncbi:MAG: PRC-barrel domain-containing protein [Candidatus Promineifilaceae bacterium]|nr:PRC-barrel domain-containing protein [Candidatus Promineifilaceae bacterium]
MHYGTVVLSAETLKDDSVKNTAGEDLGTIEEIMLDVENGRISYAVLSFGGLLGLGDKLFAIPWSALRLDTNEKVFYLDVPKNVLENAPGFDEDDWPDFASSDWGKGIHDYYDVEPYWLN